MTISDLTAEARRSLGLPASAVLTPAGGATGLTWRVDGAGEPACLRITRTARGAAAEIDAMAAAAAVGVPVPDVLARAGGAALLTWLPGRTALEVMLAEPRRAYEIGGLMGRVQAQLHQAVAPASAPPAARWHGVSVDGVPAGEALLHLDWHPLNILIDGDRVSGVLDWANAAAGSPWLDVARTYTMFTLDPGAQDFATADPDGFAAVRAGWWDGYGATEADVPAAAYRWAGAAMLADLGPRYAAEPDRLTPLRSWLADL